MKAKEIQYKATHAWGERGRASGILVMMNPQDYENHREGLSFFEAYSCYKNAMETLKTLLERIRPYEEQDEEEKEFYPEGSVSTMVYSNQMVHFVFATMIILTETGFGKSIGDKVLRFPDTKENLTYMKIAGDSIPLLKIPHEEDVYVEFKQDDQ